MEDLQVSIDESPNDVHSFLEVELEALKSIYINELNVKTDLKSTDICIDLYPATADNLDQQYVRMTLQFLLDEGYPEDIPEIVIRNPRGLSEEKQNSIMKDLLRIAEDKRGNSMLFEIIEAAKEHLTVGNRPCGECAICLCGFSENDVFTKTECYHHFHSHCLARYSKNFVESSQDYETDPKNKAISNELLCPMCRVPIEFNSQEDYPPPEGGGDNRFVLTEDVKELQGKMAKLFQEQVEKGGIIDIEAEKNKYLIEISNVPTRAAAEDKKLDDQLKSQDDIDVDSASKQTNGVDSPIKQKKTYRDPNTLQDHRSRNQPYHRYDTRGNNRYNGRYNRPSYNDSRSHYNQHKYHRYPNQKYNNYERYERYTSNNAKENNDHFEKGSDYDDKEPPDSCLDSVSDNIDEHAETHNKSRYNPDRRYNRGYNRYNNSYNSRYDGAKRSDKTSEHDVGDGSRPEGQDDLERFSNNSGKKFNYRSDDYCRNSRYSGDRQRSETFTSDEQFSKASNVSNSEDLISSSDDVAQKEKPKPYYSPRKPSYRSDYRDKPKYDDDRSNRSHYAKVRHSKAINKQDVEDDDEIVTDYQNDKRTTDYDSRKANYRQNFDYNSSDRYSDRNSQRGGRRGFGRRGNYSGDSNFSGRNSYRDSERDQSYSERNRSFRGKESSRGNQYRGNESQDGYRHKNLRNFDRNSYAKHTNKADAQLSHDNDQKSADFSSRSQSSDSNQLSIDKESPDTPSNTQRYQKRDDDCKILDEKDTSVCDTVSSKQTPARPQAGNGVNIPPIVQEKPQGSFRTALHPPPGFANPLKKVIYGLQGANPPPGFNKS